MIAEQELQRGITVARGIWVALFASLILYVAMAPMVFGTAAVPFSEEGYRTLRLALYGGALLTLVLTWVIRRTLLTGSRPAKVTRSDQHPAVSRYIAVMMVTMGMSEAIGVYGLILYILGQHRQDLYLLTLLSAAAMLLYFPKKEEIVTLAQSMPPQRR